MAISLKKGHSFDLTKKEPSLQKILVGLGWDVKPGNNLDLDAVCFMLGGNKKLVSDDYFVFYNNFCLLYTSPSPRDGLLSRMPSSA